MKNNTTYQIKKFSPFAKVKKAKIYQTALLLCSALKQKGFEGFIVGGSVRDLLIHPNQVPKDIDIATSANPKEILSLFKNVQFVGESFGVCLVTLNNCSFEVTTFRKEGVYLDRRHPESISQGTHKEDSNRRDFTMNSLYFDPLQKEIIDFHGGIQDIKDKIIRCVGNSQHRIHEDVLRILRMCRFSANLNFSIFPESKNAAKKEFSSLHLLSKERILLEFQKIKHGQFYSFVKILLEIGDIKHILKNHDFFENEKNTKNKAIQKAKKDTKFPFFNFLKTLTLMKEVNKEKINNLINEIENWPISSHDRMISIYFFKLIFLEENTKLKNDKEFIDFIFYNLLRKIQEKSNEDFKYICDILNVFLNNNSFKKILTQAKILPLEKTNMNTQKIISIVNKKKFNKKIISLTIKYLEYLQFKNNEKLFDFDLEEIINNLENKNVLSKIFYG